MPSLMSLTPWRRKKRVPGGPVTVRTRRRTSLGALWRRLVRTLTCARRPYY
uniref:Uncharacterized protein n=1 Tax=Zea mays TaxID=4577 RepID=B6UH36_MAIZE|nr:hypothetical protein [Zea mays]